MSNITPKKFASESDWAEISEMADKSLRKMIYEFAEEYAKEYSKGVIRLCVEAIIDRAKKACEDHHKSLGVHADFKNYPKLWHGFLSASDKYALTKAGILDQ